MAKNDQPDIIFNIMVKSEAAQIEIKKCEDDIKRLEEANKSLSKENKLATQENINLAKAIVDGMISYKEAVDIVTVNNQKIMENSKLLSQNKLEIEKSTEAVKTYKNEIKENNANEGIERNKATIAELTTLIGLLKDEYQDLSATERESAEGFALEKSIGNTALELQNAQAEMNSYSDALKKYQEAMIGSIAGNSKFGQSLLQASTSGKGLKGVIGQMKTSISAFFKVIITNPVMAILSVLTMAFMAIKDAIASNEEVTKKLNKALEPLSFIFDALVSYVTWYVEKMIIATEAVVNFLKKIPFVKKHFEEQNAETERSIKLTQEKTKQEEELIKSQQKNVEDLERMADIQEQLRNKEKLSKEEIIKLTEELEELEGSSLNNTVKIAKIRAKLEDEKNLTFEERKTETEELNRLEIEMAKNAVESARATLLAERAKYGQRKLSVEQAKELKSLEEALDQAKLNLDKTERDGGKRLQAIKDDENKAEDDRQKKAADVAKKHQEEQKKIQEKEYAATVEMKRMEYETEIENQKAILENQKLSYEERHKAFLDYEVQKLASLNYEKEQELANEDLTQKERELINKKYQKSEEALKKELTNEGLRLEKEKADKENEIVRKNFENKLAAAEKGSEDEFSLRLQQMNQAQEEELRMAKEQGLALEDIEKRHKQELIKLNDDHQLALEAKRKQVFENELKEAELKGQNTLALKLQQKQAELDTLTQLQGESDEAFKLRELQLQADLKVIKDEMLEQQLEQRTKMMEAVTSVADAFTELLGESAEDNVAFAAFQKAMALYQIGMDTATALTAGIAASQKAGPFPKNLIAIATTVATVLSNIAKAKKMLNSEKEPKAPKLNQGGLVTGPGSGTSDSIKTYLSNGESVLTARATSMFSPVLSAFNQIGGGVPISTQNASSQMLGEDMLTRSFAKAVATLPNPVVSLEEINYTRDRVEVIEASRSL